MFRVRGVTLIAALARLAECDAEAWTETPCNKGVREHGNT
jgi:hypothetical protein